MIYCPGFQDKIKVVVIGLADRPSRYKENVYPETKVKGESLDLIKYIDRNFEGPSLLPEVCIYVQPS